MVYATRLYGFVFVCCCCFFFQWSDAVQRMGVGGGGGPVGWGWNLTGEIKQTTEMGKRKTSDYPMVDCQQKVMKQLPWLIKQGDYWPA
jgi:hypothetical protein